MATASIQNANGSFTTYDPSSYTPNPTAPTGTSSSSPTITSANPAQPPSSTMDASSLASPSTPIPFPTEPSSPSVQGVSNNLSVPSPIPGAQDLINQGTQSTPAETQHSALLNKIAGLIGQNQGQTQLTNTAEASAGVPGLTKTVNDLSTQLEGLNNQATDLANQAQYTIPNQERLAETGGNIQAAMNGRPVTKEQLLNIQIKQGAIASQSLTLKSAIYAAQGNLTLAKDAADKAAQAQFEGQQQQIDYVKAQLDALAPQLTKDEKAQALTVQTQLQDRQTQINLQIENFKTGQAAVADALKNNPNDPAAQYAAQQAAKLDPNDPQYLNKVQQLVGKYATDLTARALDMRLKNAQISNLATSKQDTLEQQYRTALEKQFSARSGSLGTQSQKVDQAIHLRTLLDQYKDANGNYSVPPAQYAELAQGMASLLSGNNSLSDSRVADIQQKSTQGDLGALMTYITGTNYSGSTQSILKNLSDSIDRQGGVAQQLRDQYVKGLQGLAPTGLDPARAQAITQQYLPSYSDAQAGKYTPSAQPTSQTITAGGKQFSVGQVYEDAMRVKWTVDATGKWTKQ